MGKLVELAKKAGPGNRPSLTRMSEKHRKELIIDLKEIAADPKRPSWDKVAALIEQVYEVRLSRSTIKSLLEANP
jgi:phage-related protein